MHNSSWFYSFGPRPTYNYPHYCGYKPCKCDPRPVIGCWSKGSCGPANNTFHFSIRGVKNTEGKPVATQFYCMDCDDSDYCMWSDKHFTQEELSHLIRWIESQPILDIWLIQQRLTAFGFRR